MTQSVAEVRILAINALGAGILMFVAGVAQKIMNDLDELKFKRFLNQLDRAAMSDPFAVTVATVPIIAAVVYFLAYRFGHLGFPAGLLPWRRRGRPTQPPSNASHPRGAGPHNTPPTD